MHVRAGGEGLGSMSNAGENASKKSKLHVISPGDRIFRSSEIQTRILGTTEGALELSTQYDGKNIHMDIF